MVLLFKKNISEDKVNFNSHENLRRRMRMKLRREKTEIFN